jgi:hypothetical protein
LLTTSVYWPGGSLPTGAVAQCGGFGEKSMPSWTNWTLMTDPLRCTVVVSTNGPAP